MTEKWSLINRAYVFLIVMNSAIYYLKEPIYSCEQSPTQQMVESIDESSEETQLEINQNISILNNLIKK